MTLGTNMKFPKGKNQMSLVFHSGPRQIAFVTFKHARRISTKCGTDIRAPQTATAVPSEMHMRDGNPHNRNPHKQG